MIYVLFNPKANNSLGEQVAREWGKCLKKEAKYVNVINLDCKKFFSKLSKDDEVILAGGDGTLNFFANDVHDLVIKPKLYYLRGGSGNDFYRDVMAKADKDELVELKPYLEHLPLVTINDTKRYFVNNIGFGLDGQCCEVADNIRRKSPRKKINYTAIAIKLLLGKYKLRNATVEVDGKVSKHKNVWLATTMHGRFYGGGMMGAPKQDRLNSEYTNDVVIYTGRSRLRTFLRFPKFSAGKHDDKKFLKHIVGHHIKVTFDVPCALQIDGETVLNVSTYIVDAE